MTVSHFLISFFLGSFGKLYITFYGCFLLELRGLQHVVGLLWGLLDVLKNFS